MDSKISPTNFVTIAEEKNIGPQAHKNAAQVDMCGIDEQKLIRKVDLRLIPWFCLLYTLSFLDRTSIGNAKLYNLEEDLKISDDQYLASLTVFFISYAIFEVPSNIFLKRLRPSIWLPLLMMLWGLVMTLQGLARNYGGIVALRWMLGTFEAGLYPGMAYYLSCWYKRSELGLRIAVLQSATTFSGAFGGLLAAAISNMHGVGGKPAWAWIFILEGLATILVGITSFWVVQDFPDSAAFLTLTERSFIVRRLEGDDQFSAAGEEFKMRHVWASFRDWKTWFGMVQLMGCDMPLYAFSLFLPSIINQLGFHATPANLLSVPVYAFACTVTCCVGLYADRHRCRGYCNIVCLSIGGVGYIILTISRNAALSYFAVFVATCGIFPVVPNTVTWIANSFEGSYKRGVSLALATGMGNLNGAVSSNVYRAKDAPWYPLGHGLVLMYICIGIVANCTFLYLLRKENARRDRGERNEAIHPTSDSEEPEDTVNGCFATVNDAKREKGDLWSGFRYML